MRPTVPVLTFSAVLTILRPFNFSFSQGLARELSEPEFLDNHLSSYNSPRIFNVPDKNSHNATKWPPNCYSFPGYCRYFFRRFGHFTHSNLLQNNPLQFYENKNARKSWKWLRSSHSLTPNTLLNLILNAVYTNFPPPPSIPASIPRQMASHADLFLSQSIQSKPSPSPLSASQNSVFPRDLITYPPLPLTLFHPPPATHLPPSHPTIPETILATSLPARTTPVSQLITSSTANQRFFLNPHTISTPSSAFLPAHLYRSQDIGLKNSPDKIQAHPKIERIISFFFNTYCQFQFNCFNVRRRPPPPDDKEAGQVHAGLVPDHAILREGVRLEQLPPPLFHEQEHVLAAVQRARVQGAPQKQVPVPPAFEEGQGRQLAHNRFPFQHH